MDVEKIHDVNWLRKLGLLSAEAFCEKFEIRNNWKSCGKFLVMEFNFSQKASAEERVNCKVFMTISLRLN